MLDHEVMWTGGDTDVAVPLIKRCLKAVPELRGCSFDQGFHSPSNRMALDELLELNALPKKGGKSAAEREREAEPAFAAARRKHSGVESTINNLEHRGLDKVRLRGADGFELAVGLAVVAPDIHRLGLNLLEEKRKRMRRARERMRDERKRLERQRERARRNRERSTNASHCAPPERRVPENRPTGRRPAAEPAPKPRKTDADAQMSALGTEPAPFPRKNMLRKTSGKPVIRKTRTFSARH